ncbi:hypothetical protein ACLB2K_000351 [Fragaria x ananassa]
MTEKNLNPESHGEEAREGDQSRKRINTGTGSEVEMKPVVGCGGGLKDQVAGKSLFLCSMERYWDRPNFRPPPPRYPRQPWDSSYVVRSINLPDLLTSSSSEKLELRELARMDDKDFPGKDLPSRVGLPGRVGCGVLGSKIVIASGFKPNFDPDRFGPPYGPHPSTGAYAFDAHDPKQGIVKMPGDLNGGKQSPLMVEFAGKLYVLSYKWESVKSFEAPNCLCLPDWLSLPQTARFAALILRPETQNGGESPACAKETISEIFEMNLPTELPHQPWPNDCHFFHLGGNNVFLVTTARVGERTNSGIYTGGAVLFQFEFDISKVDTDRKNCFTIQFQPPRIFECHSSPDYLLGRAGLLDEAEALMKTMEMKPDGAVWGSLLVACRTHKRVEMGEYVARHVFELEPENAGAHVLLSNIYAGAGRWDDVARIRTMLNDMGIKKVPGSTSIEVDSVVHEFQVGDKMHPLSEEIYQILKEMNRLLDMAGFVPDTSEALYDMDEEWKEGVLSHHSEKLAIAFGLISTKESSSL